MSLSTKVMLSSTAVSIWGRTWSISDSVISNFRLFRLEARLRLADGMVDVGVAAVGLSWGDADPRSGVSPGVDGIDGEGRP